MARPLRIAFPGAYYHVMNRGLARQPIFADRTDRAMFLRLLVECCEMWGVRILAYCLLDNHYHLLLETPQPNLSRVMRHLDGVYTQRYNRRHGRDGPLFRGRYTAIVVEAERYLLAVVQYIHRNPVTAGLARTPEGYEWSSCRWYASEGKVPGWLDREQLLRRFPRRNRRVLFLALMRGGVEEMVQSFYARDRRPPILGSPPFVERLRQRVVKGAFSLTEVPEARAFFRPDAETCLRVVGEAYGTDREALLRSRQGQRNEARAMAMYVCRQFGGMMLPEIARVFKVAGYFTVRSGIARARAELNKGGVIVRRFAQIRRRLQT
jgi:putative transposase